MLSEDSHLSSLDIKSFDLGGDGMIDWREFVAGAMQQHELSNADNLEKVFEEVRTALDHACAAMAQRCRRLASTAAPRVERPTAASCSCLVPFTSCPLPRAPVECVRNMQAH